MARRYLPVGGRAIRYRYRYLSGVQFPTGLIVNLDVDNNGQTDALTDGSLIMRYLFGFGGDTLINGAIGPDADRTTASEIINYLDAVDPIMLDVDSNGTVDALTDGVMIVRYLFGFTGETLINGAIGPNADRSTASEIEAFLQSFDLGSDIQTMIGGNFVGQFRGNMGLI
ncbi:MAG: hypothetical protein EBE86_033475 [Hormoscilla sp. GUM202]|nr:hypothetical protein [Hormoscilla sp. GUM202]